MHSFINSKQSVGMHIKNIVCLPSKKITIFNLNLMSNSEILETVRKTFSINAELADKLEKDAFWSRKSIKDVLEEILSNHYEDKEFDPYPTGYQRPKVGRKPQ